MTCLTVSLRGLPMWTLPEAQTLPEEPYGPKGAGLLRKPQVEYGSRISTVTIKAELPSAESRIFRRCS